MLDSLLGRGGGKVIIDRIQTTEDGTTYNELEPTQIKKKVREWFQQWHGPRPAKPLEPGSTWEEQYQPKAWIQSEWYARLMDPPSPEEFAKTVEEAPKFKAPGISKITNDILQRQGRHGQQVLFQI
ncbi:hypothetical protein BGZ52_000516, partial [Haplosporangium bisporale]